MIIPYRYFDKVKNEVIRFDVKEIEVNACLPNTIEELGLDKPGGDKYCFEKSFKKLRHMAWERLTDRFQVFFPGAEIMLTIGHGLSDNPPHNWVWIEGLPEFTKEPHFDRLIYLEDISQKIDQILLEIYGQGEWLVGKVKEEEKVVGIIEIEKKAVVDG